LALLTRGDSLIGSQHIVGGRYGEPWPGRPSCHGSSPTGYQRTSLIVSNKPFGRWGEVFGDDVVAAALIDRPVHHAESSPSNATATDSRTETRPRPHHDRRTM